MTRVISAVVLIGLNAGVLFFAPWWAAILLAAAVAALAAGEVAALSATTGAPISKLVSITGALVLCIAMALSSELLTDGPVAPLLLAIVVGAGLVMLGSGPPSPSTVARAAALMMVPVYVGLPLGGLAWTHVIYGPLTLVFLLVVISASDTAQYVCGRAFGRTKLAPTISPGKTLEGAVGGLVAAALVGALLMPMWVSGTLWVEGLVAGPVLAGFGISGDLFESMLKRGAGVKDSSSLIPGHGGVLDRIDAYLFAGPAYILYLRYLA